MSRVVSPFQQARRLDWVDGSALTWRDLRDGVAAEEAMLALHMRGLHDTWGVALGLTTALSGDRRAVLVTPGFAIACNGMTILLPNAQVLAAPPAGAGPRAWDLVLRAPQPTAGDPCYRPTTCDLAVTPTAATLAWHDIDAPLDQRTNVVLSRYVRLTSGVMNGPDLSVRRGVAVLERPHIASGVATAASLSWTVRGPRLVASIDTSGAGFSQAPIYRVWVASHAPWPPNVIGAFISVVTASRGSISVQLLVPGGISTNSAQSLADTIALGWVGVEPVRGCPPSFTSAHIRTSLGMQLDMSVWVSVLAGLPGFQP